MHEPIRVGMEIESFSKLDRLRQAAAPEAGINRCAIMRDKPQRNFGAITVERVPERAPTAANNAYGIAATRINFCDVGLVDPRMTGTNAFFASVFQRDG